MSTSLVAFDTDRIKSYVFGTSTLKEIRGASALLDRLNREDMVRLAGGEVIYANGGGGLFKVYGSESEANSVIQKVQKCYREVTGSASVTGVSVELPDGDDIQQQLKLIRYRLRLAKDQSCAKLYPITHSLFRFCDSCGSRYAEKIVENQEFICESCCQKREEDERVKDKIWKWSSAPANANVKELWGRLITELSRQNTRLLGLDRPSDFNKIGELSHPSGYMGLIYADGDAMGKEIEQIASDKEMKRFASAVDDSVYEAVAEAINEYLVPNDGVFWPFDVLLLGGDDVVMVTRAESAIEVALHLVKRFPALTAERWDEPLSLSASVVISHVKYPIGSLLELAQSGLKFAKQQGAKRRRLNGETLEGGLLNFIVVNSANHLDFKEHYKHTLKQEDKDSILYRTQRPYTASEMEKLLAQIRMLRQTGVPHGKLEQLRTALFKTRKQGTLDAMLAILRLRNEKHINALLGLVGHETKQKLYLPWMQEGQNWRSPILDITELFDFVR